MFKPIIIWLLLQCAIVNAQDLELGLRIESQGLNRNFSNGNKANFEYLLIPTCIQLNLSYYPFKKISIEGRFGREFFLENYTGFEYGLFTKYFFTGAFYLTGGVAGHSNEGGSGGIYEGSSNNSFIMPAIGLGFKPFNHTSFELMYQNTGNKIIGSSWQLGPNGEIIIVKEKLEWIVKLGIVLGWTL
ncbi:MAG: hypothetical protein ACM3Q2_19065 [Syntrophothermus sp.]